MWCLYYFWGFPCFFYLLPNNFYLLLNIPSQCPRGFIRLRCSYYLSQLACLVDNCRFSQAGILYSVPSLILYFSVCQLFHILLPTSRISFLRFGYCFVCLSKCPTFTVAEKARDVYYFGKFSFRFWPSLFLSSMPIVPLKLLIYVL